MEVSVWRSCEGFPFRIRGCSPVFPGWASQPWRTPSTTLAGAETSYFWSLHKVPCYDYLSLRAFDSFAARWWNPCILVHLLHVFFFFSVTCDDCGGEKTSKAHWCWSLYLHFHWKIAISECSRDQGWATLCKCSSDLKVELLKGTSVYAISYLCHGGIICLLFFFCKAFLGIPGVNETLKNIHQSIRFIDCGNHEVGTEVKMSPSALNLLTQTDQALPDNWVRSVANKHMFWGFFCIVLEIASKRAKIDALSFLYVLCICSCSCGVKLLRATAEPKSREVAVPGGWDIYSRCLQNLHTDLQCPTYGWITMWS